MYAFYLNETFSSNQMCTVPIINMSRADLNSHAELKWILSSCQIDESSLVFIDEVGHNHWCLQIDETALENTWFHTLCDSLCLYYWYIIVFWLFSTNKFCYLSGQIDLFYYDLFGSLKLVLLNSHKLPNRIEVWRIKDYKKPQHVHTLVWVSYEFIK